MLSEPNFYFKEIGTIFNDCQESAVTHKKNLKSFFKVLNNASESIDLLIFSFIQHLNQILACPLTIKDGHVWVSNSMTFLQLLFESILQKIDNDDGLLKFSSFLLKYLFQGVDSKEKYVRSRVVKILACFSSYVSKSDSLL